MNGPVNLFNLQSFPFDYSKNFAIIGGGPSARGAKYGDDIQVLAVNAGIFYYPKAGAAVTLHYHEDLMKRRLERLGGGNLVIIRNKDIWECRLCHGDSLDLLVRFLVKRMPGGKDIFISGIDQNTPRRWDFQNNRLKETVIAAEYKKIKIWKTCRNPRLDEFIPTYPVQGKNR